jgi:hypothetical protein
MSLQELDTHNAVRATLNYLLRTEKKPYHYTFEPPHGVPARFAEINPVENVVIRNGRPLAGDFSLDAQGFELHRHNTAVENFYDEEEIRDVYYPEVEEFLKSVTGAEKVVIFDHTIRSIPKFAAGEKGFREPVRSVHCDYTAKSGVRRVHDHLSAGEAEARLKQRVWEVNVWRPIQGPVEEAPLAVCDARTIAPDDFIASDLIYPDKVGEIYNFAYNPAHRWFYFPRMERNEALILKCFDSDEQAPGRFSAHSAFDDPETPQNPRPRESIETRALVFFG